MTPKDTQRVFQAIRNEQDALREKLATENRQITLGVLTGKIDGLQMAANILSSTLKR